MNKNTSKILIAAIAGILVAGTLAVALPTQAFADVTANGGIGGAGGAGGVGGAGGINIGKDSIQKGNANGGSANGGDGGDANGGLAFCKFVKRSCN